MGIYMGQFGQFSWPIFHSRTGNDLLHHIPCMDHGYACFDQLYTMFAGAAATFQYSMGQKPSAAHFTRNMINMFDVCLLFGPHSWFITI
jgi:hypothetical protein